MSRLRSYSLPTTSGDQVRLALLSESDATLDPNDSLFPWNQPMFPDPSLSPFFVAPHIASEDALPWTPSSSPSDSLLPGSESLLGYDSLLNDSIAWGQSELHVTDPHQGHHNFQIPTIKFTDEEMMPSSPLMTDMHADMGQVQWVTSLPSPAESSVTAEEIFGVDPLPNIDRVVNLLGSNLPTQRLVQPHTYTVSKLTRPRSHSLSPLPSTVNLDSSSGLVTEPEKKLQCPHCDKIFVRQYQLKSHLVSHSNVRPHTCSVCPAAFARKHDLQRHVRTIHGLYKSYKCGQCPHTSVKIDTLYRHMTNENHTSVLASVTHGTKAIMTFSFAELERLILCQNSVLFDYNPSLSPQ